MAMLTSINNQNIKAALRLYEKKERDKTGLFLIEGLAELNLALQNKLEFLKVFYAEEMLDEQAKKILAKIDGEKIAVSPQVFERLAYRGTVNGILAVVKQPEPKDQKLPRNGLVLVLEKMEKPGNIGAILRTAEAAGVSAVFLCDAITDLYNPNIVRASLGAVFSLPIFCLNNAETYTWLKNNNFKIIASTPAADRNYYEVKMDGSVALLVGSEKDGLSEFWLENAAEKVLIPMQGQINSLNASVSAALLIYEAVRQRSGK